MGKDFMKNNVVLYVSSIIFCVEVHFGELTWDGENVEIDTAVVNGDKILHNISIIFDIPKWVLSDEIAVSSDNIAVFFRAQLESVGKHSKVFLKITSNITLDIMKKKYISILYSLNLLNPLVSNLRKFKNNLYNQRRAQIWYQVLP